MSTPQHPTPVSFDASALTEPVDQAAVRAFAQQMKAAGRARTMAPSTAIGLIVVIIVVFVMVSVFIPLTIALIAASTEGQSSFLALPALLFVVALIAVVVFVIRSRGRQRERQYRLDRFARANAMEYLPHRPNPPLPGMIFHVGRDRKASDLVRGTRPRFVEFGNYAYTTGSGKNETTHKWGYVAVKLGVPLPHIVLDALSNNGLFRSSNLPASFNRDQRLSLEGDFDQHFALYCPAGYERDALYLFTPDIMARFIDNAAALDVEIVDDWLFLYAKREFATLDPSTWAWLFSVVRALIDKFAQWERWRDDRLAHAAASSDAADAQGAASALPFAAPAQALRPPPGVASPGRRLRRGTSWVAFAAVGIGMIWILVNFARIAF